MNWKFVVIGKTMLATKGFVSHPSGASRRIGVFMFKRVVTHKCTGSNPRFCLKGTLVADVYKVGYCVRCHYNVFPSIWTQLMSKDHRERKDFVNKCLPRAVDKKTGRVKPAFRCTGDDLKKAQGAIAAY